MRTVLLVSTAIAALGISTAQAAAPWGSDVPVRWHIMGGYSGTLGETADYFQGGYVVGGGFTVMPAPGSPAALRFDMSFDGHNATNKEINVGSQATGVQIDSGTQYNWAVNGNLVLYAPFAYGVRGYAIAGVGGYHSRIDLRQTALFGGGYCDPFYGYCYSDLANGDVVVATQSVTKFGWNAGLGIEFATGWGSSWFIEARYHQIETAHPSEYLPIEVGYRF